MQASLHEAQGVAMHKNEPEIASFNASRVTVRRLEDDELNSKGKMGGTMAPPLCLAMLSQEYNTATADG